MAEIEEGALCLNCCNYSVGDQELKLSNGRRFCASAIHDEGNMKVNENVG